jgi:hypothetical protein
LFFANRGHLQALKVRDLKLFMSESIVRFKRLKSEVKFKNMISEEFQDVGKSKFSWLVYDSSYDVMYIFVL